jgi:hypothetical protein
MITDGTYMTLGAIYLLILLASDMDNRAKWKAFTTNDKVTILAHVDVWCPQ